MITANGSIRRKDRTTGETSTPQLRAQVRVRCGRRLKKGRISRGCTGGAGTGDPWDGGAAAPVPPPPPSGGVAPGAPAPPAPAPAPSPAPDPHDVATLTPNGTAIAPADAPASVKAIIAAGNRIARTPYVWGGGHGTW